MNDHLHDFTIGKRRYGIPYDSLGGFGAQIVDEDIPTLRSLFPSAGKRFIYQYDFGDSWYHEIEVEQITPAEEGVRYPRCLDGERACPPEDSGGIWGFL